jgi:hypothetical protein
MSIECCLQAPGDILGRSQHGHAPHHLLTPSVDDIYAPPKESAGPVELAGVDGGRLSAAVFHDGPRSLRWTDFQIRHDVALTHSVQLSMILSSAKRLR